ncbi:3-oxoacyl-reductase [Irpex rosettiformis]|uniref:3-oxoacyl-reductase n=1 Tax=Irpex rosettiformis TaxID=378272 RepID=A0ACB8TV05_9APHY|nr:3-oxoacyl-reductase [Irpex rosettiformis]
MSLKNKLVLITGCTGGIGQATARLLAAEGCSIAIHYASDSSKVKAEHLIKEFTQLSQSEEPSLVIRAAAFQADLSTYENAKKLHDDVVLTLGHPDIFFGNHGITKSVIGPNGNLGDISPQMFEETWRTNTGTNFYLAQLCIPHMEKQKWGRIILTSSVAALTGGVIGPHYASSKAAMHGLIHWLSLRYAKDGICSNAIAPALIENTSMLPSGTDELRSKIPIGRLGKPDEIASIVVMLAKNAYMTNKVIVADGGWTGGGI